MTRLEEAIFASTFAACVHAGNGVGTAADLASANVLRFREWERRGIRGGSSGRLFLETVEEPVAL